MLILEWSLSFTKEPLVAQKSTSKQTSITDSVREYVAKEGLRLKFPVARTDTINHEICRESNNDPNLPPYRWGSSKHFHTEQELLLMTLEVTKNQKAVVCLSSRHTTRRSYQRYRTSLLKTYHIVGILPKTKQAWPTLGIRSAVHLKH